MSRLSPPPKVRVRECRQFKNSDLREAVFVIPGSRGNLEFGEYAFVAEGVWIPAFAGMTANMTTRPRACHREGEDKGELPDKEFRQ